MDMEEKYKLVLFQIFLEEAMKSEQAKEILEGGAGDAIGRENALGIVAHVAMGEALKRADYEKTKELYTKTEVSARLIEKFEEAEK